MLFIFRMQCCMIESNDSTTSYHFCTGLLQSTSVQVYFIVLLYRTTSRTSVQDYFIVLLYMRSRYEDLYKPGEGERQESDLMKSDQDMAVYVKSRQTWSPQRLVAEGGSTCCLSFKMGTEVKLWQSINCWSNKLMLNNGHCQIESRKWNLLECHAKTLMVIVKRYPPCMDCLLIVDKPHTWSSVQKQEGHKVKKWQREHNGTEEKWNRCVVTIWLSGRQWWELRIVAPLDPQRGQGIDHVMTPSPRQLLAPCDIIMDEKAVFISDNADIYDPQCTTVTCPLLLSPSFP